MALQRRGMGRWGPRRGPRAIWASRDCFEAVAIAFGSYYHVCNFAKGKAFLFMTALHKTYFRATAVISSMAA